MSNGFNDEESDGDRVSTERISTDSDDWAERLTELAGGGGGCLETAIAARDQRHGNRTETESKSGNGNGSALTKRRFLTGAAGVGIAAAGLGMPAGATTGTDAPVGGKALLDYALDDERVVELHDALEANGWEQRTTAAEVTDGSAVVPYDGDVGQATLLWTTANPPQAYELDQVHEELTTHSYVDGEHLTATVTEAELAEREQDDVSADPDFDPDGLLGYIMRLSPVGRASACDPHGPPESATGDSFDCCGTVDYDCLANHALGAGAGCYPCAADPSRLSCAPCVVVMIQSGRMSTQNCCSGYWY